MTHGMSAGIGVVCFSAFMMIFSITCQELGIVLNGKRGDPFLVQETSFKFLDRMVEGGESLGYVTNPDDYLFLSKYIFSASSEGVSWDTLSLDELRVIERFNRTQYYLAPHVLRLYREDFGGKHVIANFRGQLAENPAYQMGNLRIRRNFGMGVVLYYNGGQ